MLHWSQLQLTYEGFISPIFQSLLHSKADDFLKAWQAQSFLGLNEGAVLCKCTSLASSLPATAQENIANLFQCPVQSDSLKVLL